MNTEKDKKLKNRNLRPCLQVQLAINIYPRQTQRDSRREQHNRQDSDLTEYEEQRDNTGLVRDGKGQDMIFMGE